MKIAKRSILVLAAMLPALPLSASFIVNPTVELNTLGEQSANAGVDRLRSQFALSTQYTTGDDWATYFATSPVDQSPANNIFTSTTGLTPNPYGAIGFNLGEERNLIGLALWNGSANSAVNRFTVWSSPDNTFSGLTLLHDDNAIATGSSNNYIPQFFSLTTPAATQFVLFQVETNHSNTVITIAEIAFQADTSLPVTTPEPSSRVLMALGALALLVWSRSRRARRRRNKS